MKQFISAVWLSAMLLLSGCGSTKEQTVRGMLEVTHLWQGDLPFDYNDSYGFGNASYEGFTGETDILIPETIATNAPFHIELYGKWSGFPSILCGQSTFNTLEADTSQNSKIIITLWKEILNNDGYTCPAVEPNFKLQHTYDINGSWQSGTLEVIIQNQDGNLTGYVTVE